MKLDVALRPFAVILTILAVFGVIGVSTFASACVHEDGSFSVCHTAQMAIMAGCVVAIVGVIASFFIGNPKGAGAMFVLDAACGVFVAASPGTLFELCMMETMRCHLVMQPFAQIVGAIIAAVGIIAAIRAFRMR